MIEVGEASGALAPMLASVSEFYEDDVNTQLANLVALIEPAILIFMAILIAFSVGGVFIAGRVLTRPLKRLATTASLVHNEPLTTPQQTKTNDSRKQTGRHSGLNV